MYSHYNKTQNKSKDKSTTIPANCVTFISWCLAKIGYKSDQLTVIFVYYAFSMGIMNGMWMMMIENGALIVWWLPIDFHFGYLLIRWDQPPVPKTHCAEVNMLSSRVHSYVENNFHRFVHITQWNGNFHTASPLGRFIVFVLVFILSVCDLFSFTHQVPYVYMALECLIDRTMSTEMHAHV